jgi:hypothetical protein
MTESLFQKFDTKANKKVCPTKTRPIVGQTFLFAIFRNRL